MLGIAAVLTPQSAFAQACVQANPQTWNCNGNDTNGETIIPNTQNTTINLGPTTAFTVTGNAGHPDAFQVYNGRPVNLFFENENDGNNSYTGFGNGDAIDIKSAGGNVTALDGFGGPITASGFGEGIQVQSGVGVDTEGNTFLVPNGGNITIHTSASDVISTQAGTGVSLDSRGRSPAATSTLSAMHPSPQQLAAASSRSLVI